MALTVLKVHIGHQARVPGVEMLLWSHMVPVDHINALNVEHLLWVACCKLQGSIYDFEIDISISLKVLIRLTRGSEMIIHR